MLFERTSTFAAIRMHAMPRLRTYPSIRVWNIGCGDGADAYALAILLKESKLLERSCVYASDLRLPRAGVLPLGSTDPGAYVAAGGTASLAEYVVVDEHEVHVRPAVAQRVFFTQHDAAREASFNEFQLVYCPRLPDDAAARTRVLSVIDASTCRFGMLALPLASLEGYEALDQGLFRRLR